MSTRLEFDFVVAADPFRGGAAGRQLAALLDFAAACGWRCGFLPLASPPVLPARPIQPRLRALLETRSVLLLDPAREAFCRLALAYEATPLLGLAFRPPRLRAEKALVRLEAPPSAWTALLLDPAELLAKAEEVLGAAPALVPADPLLARALARSAPWRDLPRASEPWPFLVQHTEPAPERGPKRFVGRHGEGPFRAGAPLGRLPSEARGILAEEAAERALLEPGTPAALALVPGDLPDLGSFLAELAAWVAVAPEDWDAWLPPALLEALAAGVPCLVPPALEPVLGDAALAASAEGVGEALAELDRGAVVRLARTAGAFVRELFGPERLRARLEDELGAPRPDAPRPWLRREHERPRRLLFVIPNGIGIGHLVRTAAIARRLPGGIEPVFLALSQAVDLLRRLGFLAEYTPAQAASRESPERWAEGFRARLLEAIAFWDPACVVFDGNVPYQPLVECRLACADRPFVWIRRGFWRPDAGHDTIDRVRYFDLVIEPGDLAAAYDRGITAGRIFERVLVPPIVFSDPEELLPRAAARTELGIAEGRTAVLLLLGSRNNYDYGIVDRIVARSLLSRPEVEVVALDWPISEAEPSLPAGVRRLVRFPIARFFAAFDFAIAACGYNSFHELLAARVPTLFVPNENPMMEEQERRALWAERAGLALCGRTSEPYRIACAIERLLDPSFRESLRARAARLPAFTGAREAAVLLAVLARSWPRERRPDRLPAAARDSLLSAR
ncbi:MAG: hypothetical protein RMK73_02880 [Geminicoccaceae bacterium]|nr:hypothetical protein [Geminicoccaceae bacterium]MDW8340408.1 hypothetical protein [Geminicoccaceae bacterium]